MILYGLKASCCCLEEVISTMLSKRTSYLGFIGISGAFRSFVITELTVQRPKFSMSNSKRHL